jgi:MFS family permease
MDRAHQDAGDAQPTRSRRSLLVAALGITQIFAWGCSYYLPAVLAKPITAATGWPLTWVVGGLSIGLLVAGLISPIVGRKIQQYGGRPVLALSSVLLALGLLGIAALHPRQTELAAWLRVGRYPRPGANRLVYGFKDFLIPGPNAKSGKQRSFRPMP